VLIVILALDLGAALRADPVNPDGVDQAAADPTVAIKAATESFMVLVDVTTNSASV
jgi:hypothetical protein